MKESSLINPSQIYILTSDTARKRKNISVLPDIESLKAGKDLKLYTSFSGQNKALNKTFDGRNIPRNLRNKNLTTAEIT